MNWGGLKVSMNNDLISREALKEELKQYFSDGVLDSVSAKLALNMILRKINEAPSVEGFTKEDMSGAYSEGYVCGNKEAEKARPQGEWITRHKLNSFGQDVVCFECNKCGEYKVPLYHLLITEPLKVCPNCGADMRKGGA